MSIKKGFTLVEMLIVVVVVGILMLIGLGLNRNQLAQLKAANTVEEVQSSFDELFLKILSSSSYQTKDPQNPDGPWITQSYSALELLISPKSASSVGTSEAELDSLPIKYRIIPESETAENSENSDRIPLGQKYELISLGSTLDNRLDENITSPVVIKLLPFQTTCEIFSQSESGKTYKNLSFGIQPKGGSEAKFKIQASYCRLAPQSPSDN